MADKEKEILEENYNLDEDFEDEEEIVTLHNENTDKDEDFRVVWYIEDGGKNYLFLNPVDPSDDIAEDEVLICEYGETKNGEEFVNPVDDEKELERIYNLHFGAVFIVPVPAFSQACAPGVKSGRYCP